jgi:hypothetical protein
LHENEVDLFRDRAGATKIPDVEAGMAKPAANSIGDHVEDRLEASRLLSFAIRAL